MKYQEAHIIALQIEAEGIKAEIAAMQAHDAGTDTKYTEQSYLDKANALYVISQQIFGIIQSGAFC